MPPGGKDAVEDQGSRSRRGLEVEVRYSSNGEHLGDFYVLPSGLIWCPGTTTITASDARGQSVSDSFVLTVTRA